MACKHEEYIIKVVHGHKRREADGEIMFRIDCAGYEKVSDDDSDVWASYGNMHWASKGKEYIKKHLELKRELKHLH